MDEGMIDKKGFVYERKKCFSTLYLVRQVYNTSHFKLSQPSLHHADYIHGQKIIIRRYGSLQRWKEQKVGIEPKIDDLKKFQKKSGETMEKVNQYAFFENIKSRSRMQDKKSQS